MTPDIYTHETLRNAKYFNDSILVMCEDIEIATIDPQTGNQRDLAYIVNVMS